MIKIFDVAVCSFDKHWKHECYDKVNVIYEKRGGGVFWELLDDRVRNRKTRGYWQQLCKIWQ
jgi:predicted GNAT superfamily acetyltransferase